MRLKLPYVSMGRIDSLDLFGVTELIIFAFYKHNKNRYHKVLDIGANIGLHSVLMDRNGWQVKAYEPDFSHFTHLVSNLKANHSKRVSPFMCAVSTENGEANFVRVLNNLTGNHLEGYKDSYGPRESLIVPTVDCRPLFKWADFAKIDSEGNEADLIKTLTTEKVEMMVEVRNEKNARIIFDHCNKIDRKMWSQKSAWKQVKHIDHMPRMNREGSLFIGNKPPFDNHNP